MGKVILWILFWYYLIPYYLLKKYAFKQVKHRVFWSILSSLVVVFVLFCWWGSTLPDDDSTQAETTKPKIHYVVKKVGRKELAQAKAKEIEYVYGAIKASNPDDKLVAIKTLEALEKVANGSANKVFIPFDATNTLAGLGTLKEITKE